MYLKRAPKARAKNLGFYRGTVYDVTSFKFHGSRYSAPPLSLLTPIGMGAIRKFSRAGQNPQHLKKFTVFRCAEAAKKFFALLRHFRLRVRVFIVSAEGASENVRVFHRRAAYDVIFFKFHGEGASAPPFAPTPCGRPCPWALTL